MESEKYSTCDSQSVIDSELNLIKGIKFGEWSEDEEECSQNYHDCSNVTPTPSPPKKKRCLRLLDDETYTTQREGEDAYNDNHLQFEVTDKIGMVGKALVFEMKSLKDEKKATLHLKDSWVYNQVLSIGCKINLVDVDLDENGVYTVDNTGGYLIIHPDTLLSITSIVSQLWCPRQAALTEKLRFPAASLDMFRGTLAHDLITQAMVANVTDTADIRNLLKTILSKPYVIQGSYGLRFTTKSLRTFGEELLPWVVKFMRTYFKTGTNNQEFEIDGVRDIEDNYWNPSFGLKGKVDATIRVRARDGKILTVPLEFKTGNPNFRGLQKIRTEHRAQVNLYSLLMRPRYGLIEHGILYYIREEFWEELAVKPTELQQLIKMRNDLAVASRTKNGIFSNIPDPGTVEYSRCGNCSYKTSCSLLLKNSSCVQSSHTKTENQLLDALTMYKSEEIEFFHRWFTVITMESEEGDKAYSAAMLWSVPALEREKLGTSISNLELMTWSSVDAVNILGIQCYEATFVKRGGSDTIKHSDFRETDYAILGTTDELCICHCTITSLEHESCLIKILTDNKINERSLLPSTRFTLDKMPFRSPMATQYAFLDSLFEDTPSSKRLREYIIFKKQPHFRDIELPFEAWKPKLSKYNQKQQAAIIRAFKTDSFLFVKGMPGTGKTQTIVGLLQFLVTCGKNVLVVAYTGVAVDNILLKYKEISDNFIRIGDSCRCKYKELKGHYMSEICKKSEGADQFRLLIDSAPIVATTMLSLKHDIFQIRNFDYVLVDEASQALPSAVFGAMLLGQKYVYFGDSNQLPAILQPQTKKIMKVEDNLFDFMATAENMVELTTQYRMNSTIMNLANKLVYEDKMTCASEKLSTATLMLPPEVVLAVIKALPRQMRSWMSFVMSTKLVRAVMFFDTSKVNAYDTFGSRNSFRNELEAKIVLKMVDTLIQSGLPGNQIGLIAPYRGQVELLKSLCIGRLQGQFNEVEVNTVDQFQGREKTVIICSFTRNGKSDIAENDAAHKKSILDDVRRLNVAITRAKRKLLMVGSKDWLDRIVTYNKLFSYLTPDQAYQFVISDLTGL